MSERLGTRDVLGALAVVALWSGLAWSFARQQELWVDESTQLSGLTLGPLEVVRWLTGEAPSRFGVPGDRMPPISYWVGSAWASLFGSTELSLRCMGLLAVAVAILLVMRAARGAFGFPAAMVAGLGMALSPNLIVAGVEIRAYPLFVLASSAAFFFLVELSRSEGPPARWIWIGLAAACVGCSYTHFFGVVVSGAVFVAAFVISRRKGLPLRSLLPSAGVVATFVLGLIPFVRAAVTASPSGKRPEGVLRQALRLGYRTLGGHPSVSVYEPIVAIVLGGALLALGVALASKADDRGTRRALALAVAAGGGVAFLAKLATGSFDSLSATYNLWMLPAFFLLMGSSVAGASARVRPWAYGSVALYLAGSAGGSFVLLTHATAFAHTAADRITERVRQAQKEDPSLVVVHDGSGKWAHAYFPLRFSMGAALPQYRLKRSVDGQTILERLPKLQPVLTPDSLPGQRLLLVTTEEQSAGEVAKFIRSGAPPKLSDGAVPRTFEAAGWALSRRESLMALDASELEWMKRIGH